MILSEINIDFENFNSRILFKAVQLVYLPSPIKFDCTHLKIYSVKVPDFVRTALSDLSKNDLNYSVLGVKCRSFYKVQKVCDELHNVALSK